MSNDEKVVVWELPCKSQECAKGPKLEMVFARAKLLYDFETETGEYAWSTLEFLQVEALSFTAAYSCSPDQIKAYDKLVEIPSSPWIESLIIGGRSQDKQLHHYRIFFDDVGCYEVVAQEWKVVT